MRTHILYTGGTLGMVETPQGLAPGADLAGWLDRLLDGTEMAGTVEMTSFEHLIDSSNATPDDWRAIVEDLWAHHDSADAFVVLHGTDTMAYTSAALSYALTDFDRPIVVTGSQLPLGVVGSDAIPNVTGALRAATSGLAPGVSVFFGHHLLAGNRITKASSWAFDGFSSPGAEPLAAAGAPWRWAPSRASGAGWSRPLPYARHDVVVIDLVPGITAARLRALVTPLPEAIILRAFGVGNVPSAEPGLTDVVVDAIDAGAAVVVASQCHEAEVLPGRYEASDAIARAGAVGSRDMTLEATYAKVQFLLAQGLRGAELAEWMSRSIAGELTESHDR